MFPNIYPKWLQHQIKEFSEHTFKIGWTDLVVTHKYLNKQMPEQAVTAILKHTLLILNKYLPNGELSARFLWWLRSYKVQRKIFGYQKITFIQWMDMLHHQFISYCFFYCISIHLKTLFKKIFSWWWTKIKTIWEQSKNKSYKRNIPICHITFVHFLYIDKYCKLPWPENQANTCMQHMEPLLFQPYVSSSVFNVIFPTPKKENV